MRLPGYMFRTPITIKQATGQLNGAGEPILSAPKTIKVMWQNKFYMIRTKKSEQVASNSLIFSPIRMQKNDVLVKDGRDHIVLDVKQIDDLVTGRPVYWEVRA